MKKPVPEDFGITSQECTYLVDERTRLRTALDRLHSYGHWLEALVEILVLCLISVWLLGLFAGTAGFLVGLVLEKVTGLQVCVVCGIVGAIIGASYGFIGVLTEPYREHRKRTQYRKQLSDPKYRNVELYEDAVRRYEYRQQTYWKSLKGAKFERALARLYTNMGYSVSQTKGSGDEGVDLILWKDEKKIVVQCKGHKKPIGVSMIRDLYGAMMHFEANSAVLACPAGFTIGVKKFATDKPIQLISATDLIEMVESVGNR